MKNAPRFRMIRAVVSANMIEYPERRFRPRVLHYTLPSILMGGIRQDCLD